MERELLEKLALASADLLNTRENLDMADAHAFLWGADHVSKWIELWTAVAEARQLLEGKE